MRRVAVRRKARGWLAALLALLIAIVGFGVVSATRSEATTSAEDAARVARAAAAASASASASAARQSEAAASAAAAAQSVASQSAAAQQSAAAAHAATAAAALAASIQSAVGAAQATGAADGDISRDAVVVLDRDTGATYTAGDATALYDTASLLKIAIVDQLFYTGQMADSDTAATALQMIEYSDDDDADTLLGLVGGDTVLPAVTARYGITGATGPTDAEYWGTNQITPTAMVQLESNSLADPAVGPWLLGAMAGATCTADDGWPQCYGIRALDASAPMKQGWMCCLDGVTRLHSTGLLGDATNPDRYVVALFTEGDEDLYSSSGRSLLSSMAQQLAVLTH